MVRNGEARKAPITLTTGVYEEGVKWIGKRTEEYLSEDEVNWSMVKYYCATIEDANPNYWDKEYAKEKWGDIISPPGMFMVWNMPLQWRPGGTKPRPRLVHLVPLPGDTVILVDSDSEFFRSVKLGERLTVQEEIVAVSPLKHTHLGEGHFITEQETYRNQKREVVAVNKYTEFRFTR